MVSWMEWIPWQKATSLLGTSLLGSSEETEWHVGGRYEMLRSTALFKRPSLSSEMSGVLRPRDVVLLMALEAPFAYLANTRRPGWVHGWGPMQVEGAPCLRMQRLKGSWEVGGRYRVLGRPVLRTGIELESSEIYEVPRRQEVLVLELGLVLRGGQPRLRAYVRTDAGQLGWLTVELPNDSPLLDSVNLYSMSAFKRQQLLARLGLPTRRRQHRKRRTGRLTLSGLLEGAEEAWEVGGKYRLLHRASLYATPAEVETEVLGSALGGSLVLVEELHRTDSADKGSRLWLRVSVEGGHRGAAEPELRGWLQLHSSTAAEQGLLDTRDHLEYEKLLRSCVSDSCSEHCCRDRDRETGRDADTGAGAGLVPSPVPAAAFAANPDMAVLGAEVGDHASALALDPALAPCAPCPCPCREFSVRLQRQGQGHGQGQGLGVHVDHSDGLTLLVIAVTAGGLVEEWNLAHPERAVAMGDRLVNVNHCVGDARLMLEEMARAPVLDLTFRAERDQALPSEPSPTSAAGAAADQRLRPNPSQWQWHGKDFDLEQTWSTGSQAVAGGLTPSGALLPQTSPSQPGQEQGQGHAQTHTQWQEEQWQEHGQGQEQVQPPLEPPPFAPLPLIQPHRDANCDYDSDVSRTPTPAPPRDTAAAAAPQGPPLRATWPGAGGPAQWQPQTPAHTQGQGQWQWQGPSQGPWRGQPHFQSEWQGQGQRQDQTKAKRVPGLGLDLGLGLSLGQPAPKPAVRLYVTEEGDSKPFEGGSADTEDAEGACPCRADRAWLFSSIGCSTQANRGHVLREYPILGSEDLHRSGH